MQNKLLWCALSSKINTAIYQKHLFSATMICTSSCSKLKTLTIRQYYLQINFLQNAVHITHMQFCTTSPNTHFHVSHKSIHKYIMKTRRYNCLTPGWTSKLFLTVLPTNAKTTLCLVPKSRMNENTPCQNLLPKWEVSLLAEWIYV